jgi:methyltransferase (TIGR00027 family)
MTDNLNAISKTAYYTCAIRALDAGRQNSICNDTYANRFMVEEGKAVADQITASPSAQSGIPARHRIIDDWLRDVLASNPNTTVVILGAGFDTRAFRIPGGQWHEIDEEPIIELKNKLLPTSDCRNPLRRICIDFSKEPLESRLPTIDASRNIVVVIEGVFYYLSETQTISTLAALRKTYAKHSLVCDLMNSIVANKYAREVRRDIECLGAKWISTLDDPVRMIETAGYRLQFSIQTIEKILDYKKAGRVERFLARLLLSKAIQGTGVHVFMPK